MHRPELNNDEDSLKQSVAQFAMQSAELRKIGPDYRFVNRWTVPRPSAPARSCMGPEPVAASLQPRTAYHSFCLPCSWPGAVEWSRNSRCLGAKRVPMTARGTSAPGYRP